MNDSTASTRKRADNQAETINMKGERRKFATADEAQHHAENIDPSVIAITLAGRWTFERRKCDRVPGWEWVCPNPGEGDEIEAEAS